MLQSSLNDCLERLRAKGVKCSLSKGTVLVVRDVPYLNAALKLDFGELIFGLSFSGESLLPPADHTAYWKGEQPCNIDGTVIEGLVNGPNRKDFGDGVVSDFFLSRKPLDNGGKYLTNYDKVMQHIQMISAPARAKYPSECKCDRSEVEVLGEELPFVYGDTNASRANITGICECLEGQKLAIIGLGGTGMYLLDYLAKCPVGEIHLYDDDSFSNHNAFRAPGAASVDVLNRRLSKVQYAAEVYGKMKRNIVSHEMKVTPENISALDEMDFVFVCVDSSSVRNMIAAHFVDVGMSFIDTGLGLDIVDRHIVGQVRVTLGIPGHYEHLKEAFGSQSGDEYDPYASNIQIAELNSMAAMMSVVKWKKLLGFYGDTSFLEDLSSIYCVQSGSIFKAQKDEN
jgi:hypothetical protein